MNWLRRNIEVLYQKTPVMLLAFGILVRVKEWLANRSLWLDEAYLGMHVMKQGWKDILLNRQFAADFSVPPMGFMLAEKINTTLFGNNEMALRLFPLLCGIAAMVLFYVLAKKLLSFPVAVAVLALFVFNDVLIDYSCELKQYSTDVLTVLILSWLFIFKADKDFAIRKRDEAMFAFAGMAAITVSHPAIFILAAFGIMQQGLLLLRGRFEEAKRGVLCGGAWLVVFVFWHTLSYSRVAMSPELIASVKGPGFMINVPLFSSAGMFWLAEKGNDIVRNVAMLRPVWLGLMICFLGVSVFFKRNSRAAGIFIFPLAVAFAAGAAGRYLLGGRFSLFMVPAILLCCGTVFDFVIDLFGRKGKVFVAVCLVVFLFGMMPSTLQNILESRKKEETRDFARILQSGFQPGDGLVVNESGQVALWYYFGQNGGFQIAEINLISDGVYKDKRDESDRIGLVRSAVVFDHQGVFDGFPNKDIEFVGFFSYDDDMDFRGARRVWFFGGHLKGVQEFLTLYFSKRGSVPVLNLRQSGAALMLFEISK